MIDYALQISLLTGAFIGLIGETWDEHTKSRIKLTKVGWISLTLIVCSFGLSMYSTYHSKREADHSARQRELLRVFAQTELRATCTTFLSVFELVAWRAGFQPSELGTRERFRAAISHDGQKKLASVNLVDALHPQDGRTGIHYFMEKSSEFSLQLDRQLTRFASVLTTEELTTLENFSHHEGLFHMQTGDSTIHSWVSVSKAANSSVTLMTYFRGEQQTADEFFVRFEKVFEVLGWPAKPEP